MELRLVLAEPGAEQGLGADPAPLLEVGGADEGVTATLEAEEWLEGTPFASYLIPGLILSGLVGGSALAASVALVANRETGSTLAVVAGAILLGYLGAEIRILNQPSAPTTTEIVYGIVGVAMVVLGLAA